jgi:hypothetical protein
MRPGETLPRDNEAAGHRWHDDHDAERVMTQWGFNAHVTIEGARAQAGRLGRPGTTWYIWSLADGSYDITAIECPSAPGPYPPCELAEKITVPGSLDGRTLHWMRRRAGA